MDWKCTDTMMNYSYNIEAFQNKIDRFDFIGFDLDNTLLRTFCYDEIIFRKFFERYFDPIRSRDLSFDLASLKEQLPEEKNLFSDFFIDKGIKEVNWQKLYFFYHAPISINLELNNSFISLLKKLKKTYFLVTNGYSSVQFNKIISMNLGNMFERIIILSPGNPLGLKPDTKLGEVLTYEPEKTIFVGDNLKTDREFAKNMGYTFLNVKEIIKSEE